MQDKESDASDYQEEEDEYNDEVEEIDQIKEQTSPQEEEKECDDGDDTHYQIDVEKISIEEKNKPRCTNCKKQYKPGTPCRIASDNSFAQKPINCTYVTQGWKDVAMKLGCDIIIPSPNDVYYDFMCEKCSPDHNLFFKHMPKTYQSIIATGMYNMSFLRQSGNGYFCANEIIEFLLKHKKRLPAKSPIGMFIPCRLFDAFV